MRINIENAKEALRLLEAQPEEKFDMGYYFRDLRRQPYLGDWRDVEEWRNALTLRGAVALWNAHTCNTACCLAGLIQMRKAETEVERAMEAFAFAQRWLELDIRHAMNLFMPTRYPDRSRTSKVTVMERLRGYIRRAENTAATK